MSTEQIETKPGLTVSRIAIDRIEGLSGQFQINELSPGINLIYGPNASGKSRTAAAIQGLFWPTIAPTKAEFSGDVGTSAGSWTISCDDRRPSYRRNGAPTDPPNLNGIPSAHSDRYLLTLHMMLNKMGGDADLAGEIRKESTGGYNLDAARAALGLGDALPKPLPTKTKKDFVEAQRVTNELRNADRGLQLRDRSLASLRQQHKAAVAASARVVQLQYAEENAAARERLAALEVAHAAFDVRMHLMSGSEPDEVAIQDGKLGQLADDQRASERIVGERTAALQACGFGDAIPPQSVVSLLRERLTALSARNADLRMANRDVASRRDARDLARSEVGTRLDDAQLAELNSSGIERLAELTRVFEASRNTAAAQEELRQWVGVTEKPDLDTLRRGEYLLSNRLRLAGEESIRSLPRFVTWILVAGALLIVAESLVLARDVSPIFAALILIAVPLVYVAFRRQEPASLAQARSMERDYAALDLPVPRGWTTEETRSTAESIRTQLARGEVDVEKANRWAALSLRRDEAQSTAEDAFRRRHELEDELGVTVAGDAETLRLLADAIRRWRGAVEELVKAEASVHLNSVEIEGVLSEINVTLGNYDGVHAPDEASASAGIDDLERRMTEATAARTAIERERFQSDSRARSIVECIDTIRQIFTKLELDGDARETLREWHERCVDFKKSQKAVGEARIDVRITETRLADAPELMGRSHQALASELEHAREIASQREAHHTQIVEVETLIGQAKIQTALATAVAAEQSALENLSKSRESDEEKAAAWRLSEFIRNQTREISRPPVFRTAVEFFSHFTAGSFRLEVGDGATPSFQAVNTATNAWLELDQLSSGTRVQLLMAVRLAFIESMEQGPQLPLLMDETLGNTDDLRADAIIDATIEISRRGRQVIYFTARPEEVAKWQGRMSQNASCPPCKVIDLGHVRGLAATRREPAITWDRSIFAPVQLFPDSDRETARILFNVGTIDPWADSIDGVDLWYLVPNVVALGKLREFGMTTWSQFKERRTMLTPLIPDHASVNAVAACRAHALETALDHWKIGRSRPICPQDLRDSQAVSNIFIDNAIDLATRCEWDATQFMAALRRRELPRFQKIEELAHFFVTSGFMSDAAPVPQTMIRAYALSSVAEDLDSGLICSEDVDELLQSLGAQAAQHELAMEAASIV